MSILHGIHSGRRTEYEDLLGHPVDSVRIFATAVMNPPNGGAFALASQLAAQGYEINFSFKTGTNMTSIANGSEDARISNIAAWMGTMPPPNNPRPSGGVSAGHCMCFFHEMDNNMTGAVYRPAANHVYSLLEAENPRPERWQYSIIMTGGYTAHPWNDRNPDDYWPTQGPQIDLLGADYYNQRGAQLSAGDMWADPTRPDRNQANDIPGMVAKATNHGAKLMFPEYASSVEDPQVNPTGSVKRSNWIKAGAALHKNNPNIYSITYYEQDDNDGRINWRISGGVMPPEPESMVGMVAWCGGTVSVPNPPTISGFSPVFGGPGIGVTINGTNFTGATSVRFAGVAASFTVVSGTRIDAIVPAAAVTGRISVTTAAGSVTSASTFTVPPGGSGFIPGVVSPMTRSRMG